MYRMEQRVRVRVFMQITRSMWSFFHHQSPGTIIG
jgi:hypothetical protein